MFQFAFQVFSASGSSYLFTSMCFIWCWCLFYFFIRKYLFMRWLRSWKANNRLYRAQHGQALSLLLLCFVLQWSDDQDSPSARCNKPIKGTFTAHPRLVAGQIVGTFDLREQRRLIIYVHSGYWPKNSRFSLLSSVRPWITMTLEYWLWWFRPLTPLQCYQERSSEYWNWRLEKFRWTFQIWRSFSTSGAKGKTYWKI